MKLIYAEVSADIFTAYYVDIETGSFYHKERSGQLEVCKVIAHNLLPSDVAEAYRNSGLGFIVASHPTTPTY